MDIGFKQNGTAQQTIFANRCVAVMHLEDEGRTQIRRMLKDAEDAMGGKGGSLSELHAVAGSGAINLTAVSETTTPVSATFA
jgi:hypothetical protein